MPGGDDDDDDDDDLVRQMESHLNDANRPPSAAGRAAGGGLGGWFRGFAGAAASATAGHPSQEDEEAGLAAEARRTAAAAAAAAAAGGYQRTLPGFSTAGQPAAQYDDDPDYEPDEHDDEQHMYEGGDDYAPVSLDDHLAATNRTTNARSSAMYSSARHGLGIGGGGSSAYGGGAGGGRMDDVGSLGRPSARTLVSVHAESTAGDSNTRTNDDYHFGTATTSAGLPEYHSDSSGDDDYLTSNARDADGERHVSQMEMFEEEDQGMEPDLTVDDDDDGHGGYGSYGGGAGAPRPTSRTGSSSSANPSPLAGLVGGIFGGGGQQLQGQQPGRSSRANSDDGPPVTMTGRAGLLSNVPGFAAATTAVRSRSSSMHSLGSSGSRASQQSSLNSLNYGPVVFENPLNDTEEYDVYKEEPKAYSKGRQRMKRRGNRPSSGGGGAGSASSASGDEYGSGSGSGSGTSGDEYGIGSGGGGGGGGNTTSGSESGEDYLQAAADATNDMLRKKRRGGLKKAGSSSSSIGSDLGDAAAMATAAVAAQQQQQQQVRQEQFQQQQGRDSLLGRHLAAGGAAADDAGADVVERLDSWSGSADNRSTNSVGLYTSGDMYDTDASSYGGGSHRSPYDGEDESEYSASPDRGGGGRRHVAGHDGADGTTLSGLTGQATTGGDGVGASSSARSFGSNLPITRVKQ